MLFTFVYLYSGTCILPSCNSCIALPAGFVMTYGIIGPKLGAAGLWIGMILGLSVFCLLGILRLKKVVGANLKTSVTLQ